MELHVLIIGIISSVLTNCVFEHALDRSLLHHHVSYIRGNFILKKALERQRKKEKTEGTKEQILI